MKDTKHKLSLSQETLSILTQANPSSLPKNMMTTEPICPTCTPASYLGAKAVTR
jgi:hypothetical protein